MPFVTSDLPYGYGDLEPYIDEATMKIHHDKHHVAYTTKLNAAIENTSQASWSIENLVSDYKQVPENIQAAVRNHGGGHFNHEFFWNILAAKAGGEPEGHLMASIEKDFGSFAAFVKLFSESAANRFGSGWAWLVLNDKKILEVSSTANQDNPLSDGKKPILGIDVWEHAYYLKYQNKRPEYVENFFKVINWKAVSKNLDKALS